MIVWEALETFHIGINFLFFIVHIYTFVKKRKKIGNTIDKNFKLLSNLIVFNHIELKYRVN